MISKEELKILEVFRYNLFNEYSVKDLMRETKKNSYNWVFNSVKKLCGLGLVNYILKAGIKMYFINLENPLVFRYFSIIDYEKNYNLPMKNIFELISSSPVSYFSLIVGGSYAKGENRKNSDLDIIVIVEKEDDVKKTFNCLENKSLLMKPSVDLYVFSKKDFVKMLLDKKENLGKQFFENCLVLFGAESYYKIVLEARENGFKG